MNGSKEQAFSELTSVDRAIGQRVRARRIMSRVTQAGLAERLAISFQQLQKYERGKNRISASMLLRIGEELATPASWFLGERADRPSEDDVVATEDAFRAIADPSARRLVLGLAQALAGRAPAPRLQLSQLTRMAEDVLTAFPIPAYLTDSEGMICYFNEASEIFAGRRPRLGEDRWCVSWRLFNEDETRLPHDQCPMAVALKENRIVRGARAIAERPDGARIWFTPHPSPLRDEQGGVMGGLNFLFKLAEVAPEASSPTH